MKIYTSYYYQIRFFKKYMIPVSTSISDPLWFHNGTANKKLIYKDKNGVLNGIRCEFLHPDKSCSHLCSGRVNCNYSDPTKCLFLKRYRDQLKNIEFDRTYNWISTLGNTLIKDHEPYIVLMVWETVSNPCSERIAIQEYFKDNGVECSELLYPIKDNYD